MTVYFVSRHSGAVAWARARGFTVDCQEDHLDPEKITAGDVVIGSLPVNLAAKVCRAGGQYWHLSLELPRDWRGKELTSQEMIDFGARVEEFRIERTDGKNMS